MSLVHAQRFCQDMASNKSLKEKVKPAAAGLASLVVAAKAHGYDFTLDELKQAIRGQTRHELSDAHLEAIAGGGAPPAIAAVQAVAQTSIVVGQTVDSFANVTTDTQVNAQAVIAVVLV